MATTTWLRPLGAVIKVASMLRWSSDPPTLEGQHDGDSVHPAKRLRHGYRAPGCCYVGHHHHGALPHGPSMAGRLYGCQRGNVEETVVGVLPL